VLRSDYDGGGPEFFMDEVKVSDLDPLAVSHWINHLRNCDLRENANKNLCDGGSINDFLRLYWLEALDLQNRISEGGASMLCLQSLLEVNFSDATQGLR
jgi:hypothetical protein